MSVHLKVAIVTGSGGGIGCAICQSLARAGFLLVLADIDEHAAHATAALLTDQHALVVPGDVANESDVQRLFARTAEHYGRVDVVVHSAAICRNIGILDITVDEWDRIVEVNLRGAFLVGREAFRIMKEQRSGRIIFLASAAAKIGGLAAGAHYAASKAGVICFTKSLALQAAPYKINVNAVCPGPIRTAMTAAWGDAVNREFAEKIPWKEYGAPEDVAAAVVFLVSDGARYITGEILDVNGGLVMD